jgi:hypothetical protein
VTPQKWLLTPVTVEWMQALDLYGPVQRVEVLIKRGKGERLRRSVAFARWHEPDLHDFIFHRSLDRTFPKFKLLLITRDGPPHPPNES